MVGQLKTLLHHPTFEDSYLLPISICALQIPFHQPFSHLYILYNPANKQSPRRPQEPCLEPQPKTETKYCQYYWTVKIKGALNYTDRQKEENKKYCVVAAQYCRQTVAVILPRHERKKHEATAQSSWCVLSKIKEFLSKKFKSVTADASRNLACRQANQKGFNLPRPGQEVSSSIRFCFVFLPGKTTQQNIPQRVLLTEVQQVEVRR